MTATDGASVTPSFVKRTRPKPSRIYSTLWRFAFERHRVYLRRVSGELYPWTNDSVLSRYRFTNAYRAADRVSQHLIRMTYSDQDASDDTLFLRTILFKIFNKIDTWETIVSSMGLPTAGQFDYSHCDDLLTERRRHSKTIYSAAYIMPSGGHRDAPKHRMHLRLIRRMLEDRLPTKLRRTTSLRDAYGLLLEYPTLGPFLAFQYAIDLNYTTLMSHSEWSFVVAGPGALDGLSKCFDSLGEYTPEDTILWLSDLQDEEFRQDNLEFHGLWGRSLRPIDIQNLLCEVSKYTRVAHPDVEGHAGRRRIKQKFREAGPLLRPFFPPKWELNERINKWFDEGGSACRSERRRRQPSLPFIVDGTS